MTPPAAILDIDGTLVDTNYHHAIAWYRAFMQSGEVLPLWRIHRHIGMGGDQLVAALAGEDFDAEHGDDVRAAEKALYMALIHEVRPLDGAHELVEVLCGDGHAVVLASSAKPAEVEHYLGLLDVRALATGWTDSRRNPEHSVGVTQRRSVALEALAETACRGIRQLHDSEHSRAADRRHRGGGPRPDQGRGGSAAADPLPPSRRPDSP